MRFVGWSVDRVDGSPSFGTFDRRETADEWCERLRGYGNDVHVVRAEVPDERPPVDWLARFRTAAEVAQAAGDGWAAEVLDGADAEGCAPFKDAR